ncbi:MAG: stage V sporulation protein AB [Lachnospiraceae bacterium]|nr:stage V sporulation protein AB [Lachnospiraceae bacterium]MDD6619005.1 stage V sporulation protein AB [Clostridiales bacterium]MDY4770531.1 stage V sporulation protein AB [Lachnospiraceae bacterium]
MWQQIGMAIVGFGGGMIAAGGMVALLIGLGITPRFAGITHTADRILLYEDFTMLGAVAGNVLQLYEPSLAVGKIGLAVYGLGAGMFLGAWILALAEMVDVFPIAIRRLKIKVGVPLIIVTVAAAKICGSLLYFYQGMYR